MDQGALERRLKRMAIQIAAQMPEDEAEALAVLGYVRELLVGYMRPDNKTQSPLLRLVREPASE